MRRVWIAAALMLTACQPVNRIQVVTTEAASARLELCGRPAQAMPRTAEGFELRAPADCRGSGKVVVTYPDGAIIACPIKIVVADMAAWYRFQVSGRTCVIG